MTMTTAHPELAVPGALMAAEIAEQPAVWQRLLDDGRAQFAAAAARIREYDPRFVLFVARGTSDHAALYAKYLTEIVHGRPAGLVSPSTMTAYGARPDLRDTLMIGVSQSGGSPDLVQSLQVAREQGALTVAVTNKPGSPLAAGGRAAPGRAGRPGARGGRDQVLHRPAARAVPAAATTSSAATGRRAEVLPELGRQVLEHDAGGGRAGAALPFRQPPGQHGPRLLLPDRPGGRAQADGDLLPVGAGVLRRRPAARAAGHDRPAGPGAHRGRRRGRRPGHAAGAAPAHRAGRRRVLRRHPGGRAGRVGRRRAARRVDEALSPILEILPFQQLALHLALARGGNPDAPRGLRKVTETL